MNIISYLQDRGLGVVNGELIKVRNTNNNLGKSVDLILRELVIGLAREEDAEAQTLYAAQQRLREAWCAFAVPFWAGVLEAWAMILEFIGNPARAVRRWTGRRPTFAANWTERAADAARGIIRQHFDNDDWVVPAERGDGRSPSHLHWMALELVKAEMSPTKACRWLGYLQAGLIYSGLSTLEREKLRNLETGQ